MSCGDPCGSQFNDKDSAFIRKILHCTDHPFGEDIVIKKYIGVADAGDPASGVQELLQFNRIPSKGILESVTQRDVLYSGGIYQIGDIRITMIASLNIIDAPAQVGGQSKGDRIIWEGHEYRIVGKVDTQVFLGETRLNAYVMRKIGDA